MSSDPVPVLVTGFEPFGGETVNPSELIVHELRGRLIDGCPVKTAVLPCEFGRSLHDLALAIDQHHPQLVICLGQAGGRSGLTVERIAINLNDAPIPDNVGRRPIDEPIDPTGPAACWSTLPIKAIVRAVAMSGIEASVSQTAGAYVCNHVFYGLMRMLENRPDTRGGFIHVPFLPDQAASRSAPAMPLPLMVRGIEIAISTALDRRSDEVAAGGQTH
jgi:pyroglutamyl-peptidase